MRDPWLLTQIARQLVFLMPLTLLVWRAEAGGSSGRWLVLVMTAGYMAGRADLVDRIRRGRSRSACFGAAAAGRNPARQGPGRLAAGRAVHDPAAARRRLFQPLARRLPDDLQHRSALCCATLNYLYRTAARRNQFARRGADNMMRSLGEMLIGTTWCFAAFLMLKQSLWALLPVGIALLPLHRLLRRAR